MISYWEQASFTRYDCIVIGAGLVGLSTAIEWRMRFPGQRILVLERGLMSTGASSRNAGFACTGNPLELGSRSAHRYGRFSGTIVCRS
ncbi:MAG: FAD-dependent oxidoreductase [Chitinophagaceae bacterium]